MTTTHYYDAMTQGERGSSHTQSHRYQLVANGEGTVVGGEKTLSPGALRENVN